MSHSSVEGNIDSGSLWERCARQLSLNTVADLTDLQSVLTTILSNCSQNPTNMKYFNLKLTNKLVQGKIVSREGGIDFLNAVGFDSKIIEGEKMLCLDPNLIESLETSLHWLVTTIQTCKEMALCRSARTTDPCCECIIQIKLPTGSSVCGGFMANDLVSDVISFARCFFRRDRSHAVTIRQAVAACNSLNGDGVITRSLREMGLYPRATLLASLVADADLPAAFKQSKVKVESESAAAVEKAKIMRGEKLAMVEKLKEERRLILGDFKNDRSAQHDRRSRFAAASAVPLQDSMAAEMLTGAVISSSSSGSGSSRKSIAVRNAASVQSQALPVGYGADNIRGAVSDEDLEDFISVTGADEATALRLLTGAVERGMDPPLDHALAYFYEHGSS